MRLPTVPTEYIMTKPIISICLATFLFSCSGVDNSGLQTTVEWAKRSDGNVTYANYQAYLGQHGVDNFVQLIARTDLEVSELRMPYQSVWTTISITELEASTGVTPDVLDWSAFLHSWVDISHFSNFDFKLLREKLQANNYILHQMDEFEVWNCLASENLVLFRQPLVECIAFNPRTGIVLNGDPDAVRERIEDYQRGFTGIDDIRGMTETIQAASGAYGVNLLFGDDIAVMNIEDICQMGGTRTNSQQACNAKFIEHAGIAPEEMEELHEIFVQSIMQFDNHTRIAAAFGNASDAQADFETRSHISQVGKSIFSEEPMGHILMDENMQQENNLLLLDAKFSAQNMEQVMMGDFLYFYSVVPGPLIDFIYIGEPPPEVETRFAIPNEVILDINPDAHTIIRTPEVPTAPLIVNPPDR